MNNNSKNMKGKAKKAKQHHTAFRFQSDCYPSDPGCYLMKNTRGQVIYVGKAKNIRRRLASYFRPHQKDYRARRLVPRIANIEVILVNTETESLILENNLIKHYKPRYNRMLMRDDTGYPFIVLTGENFPRLLPYRKNWFNKQWEETKGKASGKRFGPYLNKSFRDTVLNFAIEKFGLRICHTLPKKVCLRYQLEKCSGICEKRISPEDYAEAVKQATTLLSYRYTELLKHLQGQMREHAERLEFEKAKKLRDQIQTLENVLEKQIVERDVKHDQDVLYFGEQHVLVTKLQRGLLQELRLFRLASVKGHAKACEQFLLSHYTGNSPKELIVNSLSHPEVIEKTLSSTNQRNIRITLPQRGIKHELLMLCQKNYQYRITLF